MNNKRVPVNSHMANAHGMCGTLSRKMSGRGGYFFMSGTRLWTITITNAVIHVTINKYTEKEKFITTHYKSFIDFNWNEYLFNNYNLQRLIKVFHNSGFNFMALPLSGLSSKSIPNG